MWNSRPNVERQISYDMTFLYFGSNKNKIPMNPKPLVLAEDKWTKKTCLEVVKCGFLEFVYAEKSNLSDFPGLYINWKLILSALLVKCNLIKFSATLRKF